MVTNNSDCIQKVIVAEGVCTDVSGNFNIQGSKEVNINRTVPIVTITPNGTTGAKSLNVIITAGGASELKSDNEYQYCLTTNQELQGNEEWQTYTNGASFTIGTGLNGTYYIHTKKIYDVAGNESIAVTSNPFVFDNTGPIVGAITGSGTSSNITLKSTVTDTTGVNGYAISTSTTTPSSWNTVDTTTSWSASVATTNTGTVYLHVKDNVGNTNYGSVNVCTGQTNSCSSAWTCSGGTTYYYRQCNKCGYKYTYSTYDNYGSSTAYHMVCSYCGKNSWSSDGTSSYCYCQGYESRSVFCCSYYNAQQSAKNSCSHGVTYSHTVACGHGIYSSHKYCAHNASQLYHTY